MHVDIHRGVTCCINVEFHLRVKPNRVVVCTSTSCGLSLAPFVLEECLRVLLVKEATQIQIVEVHEEVIVGDPENTISFANLIDRARVGPHSVISFSLAALIPHLGAVSPFTLPLSVVAPRVPHLDQIVAIDSGDIQDAVSVTLNDTHWRDIGVGAGRRASSHQVVLGPPEDQFRPEFTSVEHLLHLLVVQFVALSGSIRQLFKCAMHQTSIDVGVATMELSVGLFDQKWPDLALVRLRISDKSNESVSSRATLDWELVVNGDNRRDLAVVQHN